MPLKCHVNQCYGLPTYTYTYMAYCTNNSTVLGYTGANYHDALPVVFWRLLFCCKTRAEDVLAAINAIAVAEPMLIGLTPQLWLAASRLSVCWTVCLLVCRSVGLSVCLQSV